MPHGRRGTALLLVISLCLLVVSAACGGSSSPTSTTTTNAGTPTEAAASATTSTEAATPTTATGAASTETPPAGASETTTTAETPTAGAGAEATNPPSDVTLTLYSGQHESLTTALADGFTKATGIKVEVRAGSDADLANQIIEEGDRAKADVFITEEPSQAGALDGRGLFAPVDPTTLANVDERFNPTSGNWVAYAARSRVIFYNPDLISEEDLPKSIFDLTKPEWKGKFAYAPSGAFTATVTYLVNTIGEDATLEWLKGIKANGENLQKNGAIRDAVEAGQIPFGLSNHYYWYILAQQQGGADKLKSKVHYMGGGDPGALVLASGAGVLKTSSHPAEAQSFLAWLTDADGGQQVIATTTPQYPLAAGVESSMGLRPLDQLDPPAFDQGSLQDVSKARDLIIEAGII